MTKKKLDVWALAKRAKKSEPLRPFLDSIQATESVVDIVTDRGLKMLYDEKEKIIGLERSLETLETTASKQEDRYSAHGMIGRLMDELQLDPNQIDKEKRARIDKHLKDERNIVDGFRKEVDGLRKEFSLYELNSYQLFTRLNSLREILLPMVFVYRFTLWDAFILDTARKILRIHPQSILMSEEKVNVSKSILWNADNLNDVKDYIINQEVSKLSDGKKMLIETFGDYFGIDWTKSGQSLKDLKEITARRNIWIHNYGKIDEHYLRMIGSNDSKRLGETAEVTRSYLTENTIKLVKLSVYIHKVADKKHYASNSHSK